MLGGISIWQLLIVLGIIILIFGTKKLRNIGGDLGNAVKGFKKAVSDEDKQDDATDKPHARVSQEENGHISKPFRPLLLQFVISSGN